MNNTIMNNTIMNNTVKDNTIMNNTIMNNTIMNNTIMNNTVKDKFFTRDSLDSVYSSYDKNDFIENESYLLKPSLNNKTKINLEIDSMSTKNYGITYNNTEADKTEKEVYYRPMYSGPGRGFSEDYDMRFGNSSRIVNRERKVERESAMINRFEYLDRNVQDPNNLVMTIPRGGACTRKQVLPTINKDSNDKMVDFNY
jgi:hypothetical protein